MTLGELFRALAGASGIDNDADMAASNMPIVLMVASTDGSMLPLYANCIAVVVQPGNTEQTGECIVIAGSDDHTQSWYCTLEGDVL
jgi:hypothetical protein